MKRLFSLCVALFATITLFANRQGHFFMNVADENVQVANVESKFAQWLDLPANTTFVQFRDETDNTGIRHLSYQQYVDNVEIPNGIVLVHAKNNIVFVVNGDIMDATIAAQHVPQKISPLKAAQKVRKNAKTEDAELKIIRAFINGEDVFRYAYEVMTEDFTSKQYIDAETGDIIKNVPLVFNADVAGTATTLYHGTQAITCYENEGYYYLMDAGRNMITLDATNNVYKINYNSNDVTQELTNLIDGCSPLYNTSTQWSSSWKMQLSQLVIENVLQDDSWYTLGEGTPDIYIKIKNEQGAVIYTSSRYDDPSFPLTINISSDMNLSQPPYIVELWDYDPIGGDDIIDLFSIDIVSGDNRDNIMWVGVAPLSSGTYSLHSKGKQPMLDAHWGMEKTLDFYQEKLNRNSFDNNGAIVYNIVNQPSDTLLLKNLPSNAFAIKVAPFPMVYGMGLYTSRIDIEGAKGLCMKPVVSIDVMAHEFTHLVTNQNGNGGLEYLGESGALNESFSDIMGISVKKYATSQNDWFIGSDIMIYYSNMRSMKNPHNSEDGDGAQPSYYAESPYWINPNETANDHGGVHTNSGVQNFWYYLLTEGGNGTNGNYQYNITGIGIDKAVQIAYRNLIYYLTPEATFEDSRNGSIQAAIDLYGKGSQEHQSVVNAWYAVGVGDAYVDDAEPFILTPGKYVIVANRDKTGDKNWYYMTSDLGTASTKRFQAVSTETENFEGIVVTELEDKYVWTLEADGDNWKLKNGTQYVTWTSGNSANLGSTAKSLTFDIAENMVLAHFTDGSAERYLSLNATTNNNYFAFYSGTNQVEQLYFLPYDDGSIPVTPPAESDRYVVLAQRTASTNWYYMTSDLGTASNKRYQAVDAGTSVLSSVNSSNLDNKYYWEIEDNKLKTAAGYSTWTSGNSAELDATGKELTIQQQTDGTYTFSFVDGDNTRYLALNKTTGNNYFAYYSGTNQIYKLTLVKEGEKGSTVGIEEISFPEPTATKLLRDGQIFILRGDKTYTLTGQDVK